MPLSAPAERELLHRRTYDFNGFQRADGLWDIEGRMVDTKSYAFDNKFRGVVEAGQPVHDMEIRLTLNEDFEVIDIEADTAAGPFEICPAIAPNYRKIIGLRIGPGWRQTIRKELGGVEGCTHLTEMLGAMATVAYQTLYPTLSKKKKTPQRGKKPALIDSCHAFGSAGPVVRDSWPDFYTGPDAT